MSKIVISPKFVEQFGKTVAAEVLLAKEGEPGSTMFLIAKGKVRVFINSSKGEKELAILSQGDFFGEMAIMGAQDRRTASVVTMNETTVLELNRLAFESLVRKSPELALQVIQVLTERIRDSNGRLSALMHKDDTLRICAYIDFLYSDRGEPAPKPSPGACFVFKTDVVATALNIDKALVDAYIEAAKKARIIGQNGDWIWVPYPQYIMALGDFLQSQA